MIRVKGVIVWPDGRRVPFTGGAREWVAWEQYALSHGLPTSSSDPSRAAGLTMTWYLAYAASTRDQKERPGYLPWLDLIQDVDEVEVETADPTRLAPSPDPSSSSLATSESTPNGSPSGPLNSWQPSPTY